MKFAEFRCIQMFFRFSYFTQLDLFAKLSLW